MRPKPIPPKFDLKKYYTLILEVGIILSLSFSIAIMKINIKPRGDEGITIAATQEIIEMEDITQTKQQQRPPAPPRPAVPVEVPNSEIIEDEIIYIDAELIFDEPLTIPPPPAEKRDQVQEEEEDFFVVVEEMPELIGGIPALQQKIEYPAKAKMANIEGRVIIQFIVNEKGEVENPRVIRGIGGGCDEEALRVVKMAKFKPGKQRGKPVRIQYSIPILFKLRN